ncbi:MAG: FMN-binding negative transcriptional regulator [Saprospiraceae bacterium]|nr:FMN-binding negative transcriptional regulator [Saprospiraceae bacterium]
MDATRSGKSLDMEGLEMIGRNPVGTLITSYHNRPYVSYRPFIIPDGNDPQTLVSFLEKSNKQWKHLEFEDVLALFQPPVSAIWTNKIQKSDEKIKVVHIYGSCNVIHERTHAQELFLQVLKVHKPDLLQAWTSSNPAGREEMMDKVIVFEMSAEEVAVHRVEVQPENNASMVN